MSKCLTKCVVYKATVTETTSNNQETHIGLTENEFKTRFNLHKSSFKLEHKRTSTTLSDHVWKLKKKNIKFNISWQVVKRVKPFAPSNKVCGLCLQEKLSILRSAPSIYIYIYIGIPKLRVIIRLKAHIVEHSVV